MPDGMDFSELLKLEHDLTETAGLVNGKAEQAIQQVGMNTKKEWQADALRTVGRMARQYAPTIDYETREFGGFGQGVYAVEIGPNLARYGGKTGKGGLTPSMGIMDDPDTPLVNKPPSRSRQRAEKFASVDLKKGIEIAIDQSLKKAGL